MSYYRLTYSEVATIRSAASADTVVARQLGVHVNTVRLARTGRTWRAHPVPPDRARRVRRGRWDD